MKKAYLFLSATFLLSGCITDSLGDYKLDLSPASWSAKESADVKSVAPSELAFWWKRFNDPALDKLVARGLNESPDRLIAEARILEARGLRRTSRSALFPQLGASASAGREDTKSNFSSYPDNFYDARFDASYEVDIFGQNRKSFNASDSTLKAAEEDYRDVTLTLVAEITRNYIDYRAAQNQLRIASKNLVSQEQTLKLIQDLHRLGSAPRLDVERASNLVSTTRASLPEYKRQAENARLRLTVLTGILPEDLAPIIADDADIPGIHIEPILLTPAQTLTQRPDVRAAAQTLAANTSLAEAETASLFPTFTLSGFYGITDSALINSAAPWNIAVGAAVSLLDFGRIEGRIDAARAREKQAYEQYRKTVLTAVTDVETALIDYSHIKEQYESLKSAYASAEKSLELSKALYKEGEISFLDVLDAQRTANDAEAAMVTATAAQSESITRLFKSLGVY